MMKAWKYLFLFSNNYQEHRKQNQIKIHEQDRSTSFIRIYVEMHHYFRVFVLNMILPNVEDFASVAQSPVLQYDECSTKKYDHIYSQE